MKYFNVCLGETVLKTISIFCSEPDNFIWLNNKKYNFPDSDKLFLEDINGYRYKRDLSESAGNIFCFRIM